MESTPEFNFFGTLKPIHSWYIKNEKELMKKYPDKIGDFCYAFDDGKVEFLDDCDRDLEAMSIADQKFPDTDGMVFQLGFYSLNNTELLNLFNKNRERFKFKKSFLENFSYLINNYSKEYMDKDFIAIFDSKIVMLDKNHLDECFKYLHEIKAPDGALIFQRNTNLSSVSFPIEFCKLSNEEKNYVSIYINSIKKQEIKNVKVDTGLDISIFTDYRRINLNEGYKYFGIGYTNTLNATSLMLYVDSVTIAIRGIENTSSLISIPIDYFMAHSLFKNSLSLLTDTDIIMRGNLFDLNKIAEFKSWLNSDYDKPNGKLNSKLYEAGILDWSNIPNSLGLSYLSTINFYYSATRQTMSFWNTPTSDDRITMITYSISSVISKDKIKTESTNYEFLPYRPDKRIVQVAYYM